MADIPSQATAFDAETGKAIPESEAALAVAEGRAGFGKGSDVFMVAPDGTKRTVPSSEAARALREGYQLRSGAELAAAAEQYAKRTEAGSYTGMAKAAAEGALRGASFGLSDQALVGLGADSEAMQLRREENPITAASTEVLGALAPIVASGGAGAAGVAGRVGAAARFAPTSLIARGAAAAEGAVGARLGGGLLARAAGAAVGGALEGAAYGAGQVISESALRNEALTVENLLAGAGDGALFGGSVGGAVPLIGAGIGAAARKVAGGGARQVADASMAANVMGGNRAKLARLASGSEANKAKLGRIAKLGFDDKVIAEGGEQAVVRVQEKLTSAVGRLDDVIKRADEAGERVSGSKLREAFAELRASSDDALDLSTKRIARGLEKEFEPAMSRGMIGVGDEAGTLTFSDSVRLKRKIDEHLRYGQDGKPLQGPKGDALKKLRAAVSESIDDAAAKMSPETLKAWKSSNLEVSDLLDVKDALSRKVGKDASDSLFSLGDTVAGSAGASFGLAQAALSGNLSSGMITGGLSGLALGAANKAIRERGHLYVAKLADSLDKMGQRMTWAAKLSAGGSPVPPPSRLLVPSTMTAKRQFERTQADIEALDDPRVLQARLARLTGDLTTTHPQIAAQMHQQFLGDLAWLKQTMPRPARSPYSTSLTPKAVKQPMSPIEMRRFNRKVDALSDPSSVLEDVAKGKVDPDAIEALKIRRPAIFAEMRSQIMQYTADQGKALPYKNRVVLSLAFDFTADPSMSPEGIASIQAAHAAQGGGQEQPGPGRPRKVESDSPETMGLPSDTSANT